MVSGDAGTDPVSGDLTREEIAEGEARRKLHRMAPTQLTLNRWNAWVCARADALLAAASRDLASRSEPVLPEAERVAVDTLRIAENACRTADVSLHDFGAAVFPHAGTLLDAFDRLASRSEERPELSEGERALVVTALRELADADRDSYDGYYATPGRSRAPAAQALADRLDPSGHPEEQENHG